jgi:integrase
MEPMPRVRKPYVQRETTRHKTVVWYFRKGTGPRVRLRGAYESPEWLADYEAALATGKQAPVAHRSQNGTLGWLIDRYVESLAFTTFRTGTQKQRRAILKNIRKTAGESPLAAVTQKVIAAGRDRRAPTPAMAATYLKVMRAMFKWAVEAGHMDSNPADGVKAKIPATAGHHTWTLEEVQTFRRHFALGTRPRLAMDILLLTGMRRQDAILLGRQHIKKGFIHYRATKNGVEVTLPLLAPLRQSIEAGPTGDLTLLVTERGRAFGNESFGNWFRKHCIAAGVPGRAHGLRKAGATFAAESGASEKQLMALFGWTDPSMAQLYTRKANNALLATVAAEGLMAGQEENVYPRTVVSGAGEIAETLDKSKA